MKSLLVMREYWQSRVVYFIIPSKGRFIDRDRAVDH